MGNLKNSVRMSLFLTVFLGLACVQQLSNGHFEKTDSSIVIWSICGIIILTIILSVGAYLTGGLKFDGYKYVFKRNSYINRIFLSTELLIGILVLVAWFQTNNIDLIKTMLEVNIFIMASFY